MELGEGDTANGSGLFEALISGLADTDGSDGSFVSICEQRLTTMTLLFGIQLEHLPSSGFQ